MARARRGRAPFPDSTGGHRSRPRVAIACALEAKATGAGGEGLPRSGALRPLAAWLAVWASLAIGLAGLLRISDPELEAVDGPSGASIRLPSTLSALIGLLLALAALVLLIHVVRSCRRRRASAGLEPAPEERPTPWWMQAITRLIGLLYLAALAYLGWRGFLPLQGLLTLGQGAASRVGAAALSSALPSASPAITWTFGLLALATAAGALALALWVAFGDLVTRRRAEDEEQPAGPLARAVAESLEDLEAEPDARRAIIYCYARFERAAAASRLERRPSWTPSEFMREALGSRPLPQRSLATLTGLFEVARFSDHRLGPGERARAIRALDDLKAALEPTDAGA